MRAKWSMLFGPEGSIILWPKGSILFGQRGQICLAFPEEKLLGQIYQFSRIGWKSVSVHRLPVTLRYPEMLAQMGPFFQEKQLNLKGRTSLWFL